LSKLETAIGELEQAKAGTNARAIRDRIDQLDHISADFAVRRMNESITRALGGRSATDLEKTG
jgi:hypothetical protein